MKKRVLIGCMAVLSAVFGYGQAGGPQRSPANATATASMPRALIDQYCVTCHSENGKAAGLSLQNVDLSRIGQNAQLWEKVVRKLRAGMMPPAGARRPEPNVHESLTVWFENELDRAAAQTVKSSGLHRLNRTEYANAIRDLLALEIDVTTLLPADDASFGFDNIAGALSISPALLEAYVSAAGKISRMAVGNWMTPTEKAFIPPPDTTQNYQIEGLPFGSRGGMAIRHYFPSDGEYAFTIQSVMIGTIVRDEKLELSVDGERVRLFDWDAERAVVGKFALLVDNNIENQIEVSIPVKAGLHTVGITFVATNYRPNFDLYEHFLRSSHNAREAPGFTEHPHIGYVLIKGPFNSRGAEDSASRRKIFTCTPKSANEEPSCAREIISTLARRAYRRSTTPEDLEVLLDFYEAGRADGGDFADGIEIALRRILADPQFVFRIEAEPANVRVGQTYRISDADLASRLAFFLWSSLPDDELINLASQRKLQDSAVLEQQVRRMLADSRSKALVDNFAGQWLQLRNLPSIAPNSVQFPDFEENLRNAFRTETEMLFDSIIREDRNVMDMLTADYTFVNERLARHYGIANIYGAHFRRVSLGPELDARRGLLGHGSMLSVTSLSNRTSPVARGKWILENVLGTKPPDPPPNVPPLEKKENSAQVLSLRAQLEQHRANPACSGCHRIMDPIGFSLENFDAVGKWRAKDGPNAVDATSQLFDNTAVNGPSSLRQALLRYSPQYFRTFAEKLMTYGLGRGIEYDDMPTVRTVVRQAAQDDYRFSAFVMGIVRSPQFQMRTKVE